MAGIKGPPTGPKLHQSPETIANYFDAHKLDRTVRRGELLAVLDSHHRLLMQRTLLGRLRVWAKRKLAWLRGTPAQGVTITKEAVPASVPQDVA